MYLRETSTVLDVRSGYPRDLVDLLRTLRVWLTEASVRFISEMWKHQVRRDGVTNVDIAVAKRSWTSHLSEFCEEWIQFGHVAEPHGVAGGIPGVDPQREAPNKDARNKSRRRSTSMLSGHARRRIRERTRRVWHKISGGLKDKQKGMGKGK